MIIPAANRLSTVKEYYFSRKLREVRRLQAEGKDIINLGIGNPDLPPADEVIASLQESASQPNHHGYQSYQGRPELRRAFAEWYQRTYQVALDADREILPLLGSKEGIFHVSMAFLNPGDRVLIPNPGYPTYASAANLAGAEIVHYNLTADNGWLPDTKEIAGLDNGRLRIMWINYPHMPTGATASTEDFRKLIDLARKHGFLLCHDNPYSLIGTATPLSVFTNQEALDCALELNSLSKGHQMAGWRIGMIAAREDYLQTILKVKSNIDSGQFLPLQHAAIEALGLPLSWHVAQNDRYAARRKKIEEILTHLGCQCGTSTAGMFVWARVPDSVSNVEEWLDGILYNAHVFFTPGMVFGSNGSRYVRVSVCASEESIVEAFERIKHIAR